MSEIKDLYSMKLHEKIVMEDMEIIKVPGGWIYRFNCHPEYRDGISESSVFVPFTISTNDYMIGPK